MFIRPAILVFLITTITGCEFKKRDLGDDGNAWGDASGAEEGGEGTWDATGGGSASPDSGTSGGEESAGDGDDANEGGSDEGGSDEGGSDEGGSDDSGAVSIDATLEILSPATGTRFTDPWIEIQFEVFGCDISDPGTNPDGCHIHRTINGAAYTDPDTVEDPSGWNHYSSAPMAMHLGDPGGKNIRLVLVRNDGSDEPYSPQISDLISVVLERHEDTGGVDTGIADTGTTDTGTTDTGSADTAVPEGEPACLVAGDCLAGITDSLTCGAVGGIWSPSGCDHLDGEDD